jgi:glutamate dehydrogenase/leucine dehydrogenase
MIYNPKGLDYEKLMDVKQKERTVTRYRPGKVMSNDAMQGLKAENGSLVPKALQDYLS